MTTRLSFQALRVDHVCSTAALLGEPEGVAAGSLGDHKDLLRPVVHQQLDVIRQAALADAYPGATVAPHLVVAVVDLGLGQAHYWLMRWGRRTGCLLAGRMTGSPWPCTRP